MIYATEIAVGKRLYRIVGDRVFVQSFGTTGPGQRPHYSWIEVEKNSGSYQEARAALARAKEAGHE